jgi:hypothetical protein
MTDTIEPVELDEDEKQKLAQRLVDQAKEQGVDLVGPGGLLTGLTKSVLETALEPGTRQLNPVDQQILNQHRASETITRAHPRT